MDLRERLFWGGIGSVLALLAVNKQLDLQTLLTVLGRCHAIVEGWYDTRQAVQRAFIRSVAVGAAILLLGLSWFLRDSLRRNFLALCGFAFVLGFVVIRAVGFHDVDQLIGAEWKSVRMNWVLELTGLLLILMAALPRLRRG
jgi:hypothetical protein